MGASRVADPTAYKGESNTITNPALFLEAITPNDSVDLTEAVRAVYIGSDGNITLSTLKSTNVTLTGVKAGSILPIQATRVYATGTTATGLVGLR